MEMLVFVLGANDLVRDPGTQVLLEEIKDDGLKYKRFHDVVELRNEVHAALKNVLKDSGITCFRLSLRDVLIACLLLLLLGIFALNAVSKWLRQRRFEELQAVQNQCQAIEDKLRNRYPQIEPKDHGDQVYVDDSNVVLAHDVWRNGRLDQRILFSDGRPRARDQFLYDEDKLLGKRRYYLDESHRIFLVDDFASDGLLTRKQSCPDGLQKPCDDYFDLMRSPLPPVEQLFSYR
jgi:hypothetical protein